LDAVTDIKILNEKVYDTSSSADAFAGQSVGDIIKMYGWNKTENNRIFKITEVASDGEWIRVDKEVKDETAPSSAGATIETGSEDLTVTGISVDDVIVDAMNFNTSASSPASVSGRDYMDVFAANTVTSFYVADAGDDIMVTWAQLSAG
jgi:hypothetical protein